MKKHFKNWPRGEIVNIKMRRLKNVPATVLPGCCFLHSDTEHGANLRSKETRTAVKLSVLETLMLYVRLSCLHDEMRDRCSSFSWSNCIMALVKRGNSRSAVFNKRSRTWQKKSLLMSWKGKFPGGQLPEPVPHHALRGTHCSAVVVFASCLWRASRNDVARSNTIWWSSPPIPLCTAKFLDHFIQCGARMSNGNKFVQSCCDALEMDSLRPFLFVCLKWQCCFVFFKKKIENTQWT